jgi:uncharacterized protein (TIGR03067 family)
MKTKIQFFSLMLVLFLLGAASGDESVNESPVKTTAEVIATDFAKFPAEAAKHYADKRLRITGEVEKVDGKNVYLKHNRAAGGVFVIIQTPNNPQVEVGQQVQTEGSLGAVLGGSVWFKCEELKVAKAIQGTWLRMEVQDSVPKLGEDWSFEEAKVLLLSRKTVRPPSVSSSDDLKLKQWRTATYILDSTQTPNTLDLKLEDGREVRGIYLLAEDVLIICLSNTGTARPSEFTAATETGQELLQFQREKAKSRTPR